MGRCAADPRSRRYFELAETARLEGAEGHLLQAMVELTTATDVLAEKELPFAVRGGLARQADGAPGAPRGAVGCWVEDRRGGRRRVPGRRGGRKRDVRSVEFPRGLYDVEVTTKTIRFENGIRLEELDEGLLVRQYGDAYVARRWRLNEHTQALVRACLAGGLRWMIRKGHPQAHARWPSGRGRVYLAFSPTREGQWSIAVDSVNAGRDDFGIAVFNGKYRRQFDLGGIRYEFEKRNRRSGHLVVDRDRVLPTLKAMAEFDHTVLSLGRSGQNRNGFVHEYDIQQAVLFGWSKTPFGAQARIVGDEVPVDSGKNPRRVDILARDIETGDYLVIEIKRAEAQSDAIDQLQSYIEGMERRAEFGESTLRGILVAERVSPAVTEEARAAGITAYEIEHPFAFHETT